MFREVLALKRNREKDSRLTEVDEFVPNIYRVNLRIVRKALNRIKS